MKKIGTLLIAAFLIAISCNDGGKRKDYRPASIGAINSLAVVMDKQLWEGPVGDKVREIFAAPILGLSWEEPLFTINHMPAKVFTGTVRNTRSVLVVDQDSLNLAHIKSNVYAAPQRIAVIKGETEAEIIENLDGKSAEIIASFKNLEIRETQKRFLRSLNKEKALEEHFNISLTMPSVYRVGKQEDNFVWIDRQILKGTMNIIVYTMPWDSFTNDSTFVRDIVRMRDSIGQKYIPGPDVPGKTTFMVTEKAFAPYVFPAEVAGRNAVEVKGIWEINNYPMAGPFITYIINDRENHRKMVIEGFTFAPATEKREFMFELEAILKTINFGKGQVSNKEIAQE